MRVKTGLGMAVAAGLLISAVGCAPSTELSLRFEPQSSQAYLVTTDVIRDFRFEQPTTGKLREEQTRTLVEFGFTQTVSDVDEEGIATIAVVVDSITAHVTNKSEDRLVFDSANPEHQTNPLARLIGQRYTVQVSPRGKVVAFDTTEANRAVTTGFEARLAERMFNEDGIKERHEIPAMWDAGPGTASVNQTWTQTVGSPPGVLAPKNYIKTYSFAGVQTRNGQPVAVINMTAREDADPVASQVSDGMGMFARMFDSSDDYTGTLLLDVSTGTVLEYDETLVSTYLAQEMPTNADPEKGPDTLTMRFTRRVAMQRQ